jgi:hypothetical protein
MEDLIGKRSAKEGGSMKWRRGERPVDADTSVGCYFQKWMVAARREQIGLWDLRNV